MHEIIERLRAAAEAGREARFEDAMRFASEALATHPQSLLALRVRAWAQLELQLGDAGATFQACRAAGPLDPLSEVGLGMVAESRGEPQVALGHFVRAYELDASDQRIRLEVRRLGGELPETRLADGLTHLREKGFDAAIEHLRVASAAAPDDPAPRLGLVHALWQVGAREQVTNLCIALLAGYPYCLEALVYAVAVELALGRTLRTRELLARVELIDPGHLLSRQLLRELGVSRISQAAPARGAMLAAPVRPSAQRPGA